MERGRFRVLPMSEEHVEGVHAVFEECFSAEKWSIRSIREELTNELARTFVMWDELEERVVGFINVHHVLGEGDLNDIAVTQSCRRKGLAASLMREALSLAAEEGISRYTLEVRESNETAIRFYESFGFQKVGMRKNYYSKPMENALLYRLELELNLKN